MNKRSLVDKFKQLLDVNGCKEISIDSVIRIIEEDAVQPLNTSADPIQKNAEIAHEGKTTIQHDLRQVYCQQLFNPAPPRDISRILVAKALCKWRNGKRSSLDLSELPILEQHAYFDQTDDAIAAYELSIALALKEERSHYRTFEEWCESVKDCGHVVQPYSATARQRRLGWDAAMATKRESSRDWLKENVAEQLAEKSGYWHSCSGCHEGGEYGGNAHNYPYSEIFKCHPGSGCHECGGIGVVWDDADYSTLLTSFPDDDENESQKQDTSEISDKQGRRGPVVEEKEKCYCGATSRHGCSFDRTHPKCIFKKTNRIEGETP